MPFASTGKHIFHWICTYICFFVNVSIALKHLLTLHASLCFVDTAPAHHPGPQQTSSHHSQTRAHATSVGYCTASMSYYASTLLCSNTDPDELSELHERFHRLIDFVATLSMLLDIPAVVNGLNRISSSSSSVEADEVSFFARGTSNTSANKARQIMRVCRILRLMRLVYLYNQYELHKQVRAHFTHSLQTELGICRSSVQVHASMRATSLSHCLHTKPVLTAGHSDWWFHRHHR